MGVLIHASAAERRDHHCRQVAGTADFDCSTFLEINCGLWESADTVIMSIRGEAGSFAALDQMVAPTFYFDFQYML